MKMKSALLSLVAALFASSAHANCNVDLSGTYKVHGVTIELRQEGCEALTLVHPLGTGTLEISGQEFLDSQNDSCRYFRIAKWESGKTLVTEDRSVCNDKSLEGIRTDKYYLNSKRDLVNESIETDAYGNVDLHEVLIWKRTRASRN